MAGIALLAGSLVSQGLGAPGAGAQVTTFTFSGGGWGHGAGMSQWGAKGRADAGQSAAEILSAYYPGAALQSVGQGNIRVKLGTVTSMTVVGPALSGGRNGGAEGGITGAGQALTVTSDGNGATWFTPAGGSPYKPAEPGQSAFVDWPEGQAAAISVFGHSYAYGRLVIWPVGDGSFEVVLDQLPMQRYVDGLGEVPSGWHMEALRAQAVAGRTFAAYRLANPRSSKYDIHALTSYDQAYVGYDKVASAGGDRWASAVASTDQQILTWGGAPIQAFYSASNGGHTERTDYVFVANLPYSAAIPDPWDQAVGNPNFAWTRTYNGDELSTWLRAAGRPDIGSITAIEVGAGVGASGRVDKAGIVVRGTGGSYGMTGAQLKTAINAGAASSRDLLSTKFAISGGTRWGGDPVGSNVAAGPWGPEAALVVGWAADLDAPTSPIDVHIYVDGKFTTSVRAEHRWDLLGAVLPWFGPDHLWAAMVWARNPRTEICAFAINVGTGTKNTLIGCQTVVRTPPKAPAKRRR